MARRRKIKDIPDYPGPLPRKPPAPPKYLLQANADGEGPLQLVQVKGTAPEIRPQGVTDPNLPVTAKYSTVIPQRDYTSPPHNYPPREEYVPPDCKKVSTRKDSRRDVKPSFKAKQEASTTSAPALPKLPTIPRPYVPPSSQLFSDGPMLHTRTAAGKILGTGTKRFVASHHVPYLPVVNTQSSQHLAVTVADAPLGPNNPAKEINETWSAYWDDEAGAVYYYNKITGEATWIPPDGI
mmetsp:Transcript_9003/g.13537  ORF Transcript_9003/g.13537 Transcript_9003/m.13537 type:complete len:238 (+) Transcript_9003:124-837(+)|eukprot:CAMPEP_0185032984 /NCGR_PEP_ID=MMETSP1103-20130426/21566_1 /TAXON_ID=36769 /ORGANISM="Paraphysomonas bandaiensis, Strain Caron Lab Isolate" /LENGTH=237 /DNA_ID=CAMNT_0027569099 /DNA_START=44 /DNA_END=757 /DNA_ORIENTATION=+